jgi:hypothetical protein
MREEMKGKIIWQTVLVFVLISAMVTFIFSALRPAQYLVEDKFLAVSNNPEVISDKDLGETLINVLLSESFNKQVDNNAQVLKIKKYTNSNAVKVQIGGPNLGMVQRSSAKFIKMTTELAGKYYPPEEQIEIKVLTNTKIIRTPRVIIENVVKAIIGGVIFGFIIAVFTDLDLRLFRVNKNREYKTIVKQRLEKELSKKESDKLALADVEYVFNNVADSVQKTSEKNKKIKKENFSSNEKIPSEESNKTKEKKDIKVRLIAANTMLVDSGKAKEIEPPTNLPIFIEEKLAKQEGVDNSVVREGLAKITKTTILTEDNSIDNKIAKKSNKARETKKVEKKTVVKKDLLSKELNSSKTGRVSAHDIANGFAPDTQSEEGPTNQEIKDRLNRLLRGEL